jgi:hypothetical protein
LCPLTPLTLRIFPHPCKSITEKNFVTELKIIENNLHLKLIPSTNFHKYNCRRRNPK